MESGWKPNVEISPSCPRCGSSNTKFCYYNNYSLTQPRYFCKGCRRYWTKGGSLRNVPVGGRCRKNRKGKSSRLSTDIVHHKIFGNENVPNNPIGHEHGYRKIPSSSSMIADGSNIDLALVYANFVNPQWNSKTGFKLPELPSEFGPSLEFTSFSNTRFGPSFQLPGENGLFDCFAISDFSLEAPLIDNDHMMYCCGLDFTLKQQDRSQRCTILDTSNYGLPPLPGEEVASQDILWSSPHHMMDNHTMQETQQPVLGPQTVEDPNLMFGNWSPFYFSTSNVFSKFF